LGRCLYIKYIKKETDPPIGGSVPFNEIRIMSRLEIFVHALVFIAFGFHFFSVSGIGFIIDNRHNKKLHSILGVVCLGSIAVTKMVTKTGKEKIISHLGALCR
jgi:hypothetical protein